MTLDLVAGLDLDSASTRHELYLRRLENTRRFMSSFDVPVMLLRDPFNIRYITGASNMSVFNLCVPARYLLVFAEGPTILFDYLGGEHLAADLPTVDMVRTAHGLSHVSSNGFLASEVGAMATEVATMRSSSASSEAAITTKSGSVERYVTS